MNIRENRIAGNLGGSRALQSLLNMMAKGRISIDPKSVISIRMNIRGSERDFNRMVNSLSAAMGAKVERRSTMSAAHPGIWMNTAKVSSSGVAVEILQAAR